MTVKSYRANFLYYLADVKEISPDVYQVDKAYTRPDNDFVISRGKDSKALSVYGDDIWDFRQYRLAGDTGSARMYFSGMSQSLKDEVKWLMFLLVYISDSGRATGLSVSTLMNYLKALRRLALYAEEYKPMVLVFTWLSHVLELQ